jgi:large subunit ribosomal protein L24e
MVSTRTCDFSGEDIEPGTGIMYVRNDGTVLHFKDRKAEKNYFMGREARDLEWTQAGRRAKDTRRPQETAAEPEPEPEPEADADEGTDEPAGTPDLEAAEAEDDESEGAEADADADETEGEVEEVDADAEADADEEDDEE